jgi:hypothetical protein
MTDSLYSSLQRLLGIAIVGIGAWIAFSWPAALMVTGGLLFLDSLLPRRNHRGPGD